jgi:hypothetical protein
MQRVCVSDPERPKFELCMLLIAVLAVIWNLLGAQVMKEAAN